MKVEFKDKSSVECYIKDNNIIISLKAKDQLNQLKSTVITVSLTKDEFKNLISEININ